MFDNIITGYERAQWAKMRDEDELRRLNRENGVIESPDEFKGWHLFYSEPYKNGVIRGQISRRTRAGFEMKIFHCSVQCLTTARELGYIAKSDGYTLPKP